MTGLPDQPDQLDQPRADPRPTTNWAGQLATVVNAALAIALAAIVTFARGSDPGPGDPVSRGLVLGALFGAPAIIGGIGAITGRRVLLASAGAVCLIGSPIAFSGATLMFLIPGALYVDAAAQSPTQRIHPSIPRRLLFVLAVALSVPLMIGAVIVGGIAVLLALGLAAVVAPVLMGRFRVPPVREAVLLAILVGLVVAGGVSLFAMTEEQCWIAHRTPDGIRYEIVPPPGASTAGYVDVVGAGCDGGTITVRGVGLAAVLVIGAIVLAAHTGRRGPVHEPTGAQA